MQEILEVLEDIRPRVCVLAMLDSLHYLRRSGRVRWARAIAAQLLQMKPIVGVLRGKVRRFGQARTGRRPIERLIELTQRLGPLERLAVLHTDAPELETFRGRVVAACAPKHLVTLVATTIIGAHVGPRGLGVAAVTAR